MIRPLFCVYLKAIGNRNVIGKQGVHPLPTENLQGLEQTGVVIEEMLDRKMIACLMLKVYIT